MSSRARYLEFLTAAGLADKDLERERLKSQRSAAQNAALGNIATTALSTVPNIVGTINGKIDDDAKQEAAALTASAAGYAGKQADAPLSAPLDRSQRSPVLDELTTYKAPRADYVTTEGPTVSRDRSTPLPATDAVTSFRPRAAEMVTQREPALPPIPSFRPATPMIDAAQETERKPAYRAPSAQTFRLNLSPLDAAKEPLRVAAPRTPFSTIAYEQTPAEEAAAIRARSYKPGNVIEEFFSGDARKKQGALAEATIAQQIAATRKAQQDRSDVVDTRAQAQANTDFTQRLAALTYNRSGEQFDATRADKREETAAERQFRLDSQKAGFDHSDAAQKAGFDHSDTAQTRSQTFTAGQNEKGRTNARDVAKIGVDGKAAASNERPLQSGDVKDVSTLDTTLSLLDRIEKSKDGVDTGPLQSAKPDALLTPQQLALKADIGSLVAAYIQSISGAGVSNEERAALLKNVPNFTDNDDDFKTKLVAMRTRLQSERTNKTNALGAAGFKVDGLAKIAPAAPKATRAERIKQLAASGTPADVIQDTLDQEGL